MTTGYALPPNASPSVRLVNQPNRNSGCGPASVAMVAGVQFEDVVLIIWGKPVRRGFACSHEDIKRALKHFGAETIPRFVRSTSFGQAPALSIYACQKLVTGFWHAVVWDPLGGCLYDPLKPAPLLLPINQLDRRYRPFSRLTIQHRTAGTANPTS